MKLTLQIKLLPDSEQSQILIATTKECNRACNEISNTAWEHKTFNQFRLHHLIYHHIKDTYKLSAQAVVRCISKVSDSYKKDKRIKKKRRFKPLGAITYDSRILSYKDNTVSIWTINGRLRINFICHNSKYLPFIKGEADLLTRKGKFFLFQTVEIPDGTITDVEEFIGVDFGITDIATTSDGITYGSDNLNKVRDKYFKVRRSVQRKGTNGSKKLMKRLQGREQRHASIVNHTISKNIVKTARFSGRGIAIEDLTHIRERTKIRKNQRRKHSNWSFGQLRQFIKYKSVLAGVPLVVINPAYTSQVCNVCNKLGNRKGKHFKCTNCGNFADADINAACNIAQLGLLVNQSEKKDMCILDMHITS